MFISHNKAKYALISDLTRPGPTRPGPARPGPARPGPARPGPANELINLLKSKCDRRNQVCKGTSIPLPRLYDAP